MQLVLESPNKKDPETPFPDEIVEKLDPNEKIFIKTVFKTIDNFEQLIQNNFEILI